MSTFSSSFKLRKAEARDVPAATQVFHAARKAGMPWLPILHTLAEDLDNFQRVFRDQDCWVAELSGQVVGFIANNWGCIEHLYVAPEAWSMGIGSALLDQAKKTELSLFLYVFQQNLRARKFYERHGFVLKKLSDGQVNEEKEPDAFYVWRGSTEE